MQLSDKHYLFLLLAVSVLILLPNLDVLPVNIMEARNLITAREMATDGNWILTTINGEPRYEKPPLPTWLTAFSGLIFGFQSLFAMRLPVVLITLLLVWAVYAFSKKTGLTPLQSFHNGLVLITSFYIYFSGRDNQWDMYCHAFVMVSVYFIWKIFRRDGNRYTNGLLGGIFLGFSILSKGPVSLYALLLPFLISYGIVYKYSIKNYKTAAAPLLIYSFTAIIIGLSWPLYVRFADPATVLEVSTREASRWTGYDAKPFYYYWSFFTQSGLWTLPALAALIYPYMKKRVHNVQAYRLTFFWTICSVVLLSFIPEKKSRYLLPVLIPMAMNTGFLISYFWNNFTRAGKNEKRFIYFAFGLIGMVGIAFPVVQYFIIKQNRESVLPWLWLSSIALFSAGSIILWYLFKNNFRKSFYAIIAFQVAAIVFAFPLAKSFLLHSDYHSPKEIKPVVARENVQVFEYQGFTPEITWEYGKKTPTFNFKNDTILRNGGKIGLLATIENAANIKKDFRDYVIKKQGRVNLNFGAISSKGYRERLARDFYIISPKKITIAEK